MKVLITGGAGFLGSNIADHLLAEGHGVLVLDNFATGRRESLAAHASLEVVEGSVADGALVDELFDRFQPTHVIHAAAAYKDLSNWEEDIRSNVLGTVHVVRASQRCSVERVVHFQTALAYGQPDQVPVRRDHPLRPRTSYSISKAGGERYLEMSGLSWISLRMANVYGPRAYTGPMPAFYKRLKAGKPCSIVRTRRDFVYFDDFMRVLTAMLPTDAPTGYFNLSSGNDVTIEEIFAQVSAALGITPDSPPDVVDPLEDDLASLLLDPSATKETFSWEPTIDLADGVARLVAWYEAHGVGETFTHLKQRG
ncbi:MAG: NAD-dependent epimerase/dehydratase family protein [Planctomycetes bacterium]|nr:NAD-dependent epimerase/dehydratase family protein [Planctomycetota bacterium]